MSSAYALAAENTLGEELRAGDHFRYEITLQVEGTMKVSQEGGSGSLPLKAAAQHRFVERVEALNTTGGISKAVRFYSIARSESEIGTERSRSELAQDARLIVAQRTGTGTVCFSPAGPMARNELDLVAEHFDTLDLVSLLPGKEVKPGERWSIPAATVQHLCLFDGLLKANLTGKLENISTTEASFTIEGTAEGVENGATAKLTIRATGVFQFETKQLTTLTWEQTDERSQGPVSPATDVKAVVMLKRTRLAEVPAELAKVERSSIPPQETIPESFTQLRYSDPTGRFTMRYSRDWHIVGRTADHLVLRLLDQGEFITQATITAWKKEKPGSHTSAEEFKKAIGQLPGWVMEKTVSDAEIPAKDGRWGYRLVTLGKQDGVAVAQIFLLIAGPNGDQVAVTLIASPNRFEKLAARDLAMVNAIEFPK
jgi:hypothetical protein